MIVRAEILRTYEDLGEDEAFEIFSENDIDPETIGKVLGKGAENGYMNWIYLNLK